MNFDCIFLIAEVLSQFKSLYIYDIDCVQIIDCITDRIESVRDFGCLTCFFFLHI